MANTISRDIKSAGELRLNKVKPILAYLHHNLKTFEKLPVEVSWSANVQVRRAIKRDTSTPHVPALKISISVNNYGDKIYAYKLHQYISNIFKILLPLDLEPYDEVKYIVPARN
jgi:hypothetical protein